MSSERRKLLGTIITGHNAEVIETPAKKPGVLDLFRNPFASRKASSTAIDLNTVIEEVLIEQKLDQSLAIAQNAPEIEFRLLAQRIIGAKEADKKQIERTINIFHEVNEQAVIDGKSPLLITDIPKGVEQGKVATVVNVEAQHIPFNQMPGSQGLRQAEGSIMVYQRVKDNPLNRHRLNSAATAENNAQLAVLVPEKGVNLYVGDTNEQENMTAVIMLADEDIQIAPPAPTAEAHNFFNTPENAQLSESEFSYNDGYRKDDTVTEVTDLDLAA